MGVSDYIMDSKSMMFLASSQRHFRLVFDTLFISYTPIIIAL